MPDSVKDLIPVVKLTEPMTYKPEVLIECPYIVVRLADLVLNNGLKFNYKYRQIKQAGGLHRYLGYDGKILLSSIMPDKKIFGFTPQMYVEGIKALMPDFYMTPDAETYESEFDLSENEILRILEDTNTIMKACSRITPFGLVKGSRFLQQDFHIQKMLSLGINHFVFHTGDFLRSGTSRLTGRAIQYAKRIKNKVPYLALYGIGSKESFRRFSFSDAFITQNHFTKAFRGSIMRNGKWLKNRGFAGRLTIMNNLSELNLCLKELQKEYGGLRRWVGV